MQEPRETDFRLELAQPDQIFLIKQWHRQQCVLEAFCELNFKNPLRQIEKYFQGKSRHIYWIFYYKNKPFALLIGISEKNHWITADLIICDVNYQGKWLSSFLTRVIWWHLDRFYKSNHEPSRKNRSKISSHIFPSTLWIGSYRFSNLNKGF